ncbi:MAG TPA: hypothetical protein VGV89_04600 [Thermoplasmata archaeon]|nr:hypothetical protein [Thermoplasmata archaeon]
MRTGLVFVGVAFLVVGGVALLTLYFEPTAPGENRHDTTAVFPVGPAELTSSGSLWGENGSGATFSLRWSSSVPVTATLIQGAPCRSGSSCSAPVYLANWSGAVAGSWEARGSPAFPYRLVAAGDGNVSGQVSVSTSSAIPEGGDSPALQLLVGTLAAALVVGVGGVATFLGLFLRANPYAPKVDPLPRSADAVAEVYPPSGEDEPPRR